MRMCQIGALIWPGCGTKVADCCTPRLAPGRIIAPEMQRSISFPHGQQSQAAPPRGPIPRPASTSALPLPPPVCAEALLAAGPLCVLQTDCRLAGLPGPGLPTDAFGEQRQHGPEQCGPRGLARDTAQKVNELT
jgi:hypothetical protein